MKRLARKRIRILTLGGILIVTNVVSKVILDYTNRPSKQEIENIEMIEADLEMKIQISDDYNIDITINEMNVIKDIEDFKKMFSEYQNIVENAEAFLDGQEKYGVNAIFGACVTIIESGGGTNWNAIDKSTHNWFSITGSYKGCSYRDPSSDNPRKWRVYEDYETAIYDFYDLIRNSEYYIKAGKSTVNEVATSYCNEQWGINVNKEMTKRLQTE